MYALSQSLFLILFSNKTKNCPCVAFFQQEIFLSYRLIPSVWFQGFRAHVYFSWHISAFSRGFSWGFSWGFANRGLWSIEITFTNIHFLTKGNSCLIELVTFNLSFVQLFLLQYGRKGNAIRNHIYTRNTKYN